MATIKSFTSLEQSKKLAEILPIESADMCYLPTHIGDEHHFIASLSPYSICTKMTDVSIEYCTPCWSLAALLGIIQKTTPYKMEHFDDKKVQLTCVLGDKPWELIISDFDNEVDACVAMIEKLYELKMM